MAVPDMSSRGRPWQAMAGHCRIWWSFRNWPRMAYTGPDRFCEPDRILKTGSVFSCDWTGSDRIFAKPYFCETLLLQTPICETLFLRKRILGEIIFSRWHWHSTWTGKRRLLARHSTGVGRHGTARHGTARHGLARLASGTGGTGGTAWHGTACRGRP